MRRTAGWPYLAAFIALGMSLSLLGPSLTFLRGRAHVSTGEIGVLFVAQSLGYLVGALSCGRLYDRGAGHRGIAAGLVGIAAASLVIPHVTSVALLTIPVAFVGVFCACVDVGGNTLVVWHSRRTGSIRLLNGLHLFFGIGALLVPGLVNRSLAWSHGLLVVTTVIAIYAVVVAIVMLVHQAPVHTTPDGGDPHAPQTPTRILAVIGIFFFLYVGVEIGFSGWITTYAQGIHLPGRNAATWLNTVFWLSFTLGRLLAVVLAKHVRTGAMLAASCLLTVGLLLVMAIANGSPALVWVTTPLIGIAVAPQFATMIAYAEERITLSGRATSWFVSSSGIGGLALPFLIGQLLDGSSSAMPLAVLVASGAATAWLLVVRRTLNASRPGPGPAPAAAAPSLTA
ncbi:MAG: rane protein of unknown function [Ilumatobacteraceae bacterium]|nr:rane protein of unknown function [Ilumatobacteraceae bacterium]